MELSFFKKTKNYLGGLYIMTTNKKEQLSEKELRAQIEAEFKEKYEAKIVELEEKTSMDTANMEAQIRREEKSVKEQLEAMPKVSIEIPEDPNNPDDVVPVGWQGVIYAIPRGQMFEVPKVIYDIWKESYQKTKEVNKRIRSMKEINIHG